MKIVIDIDEQIITDLRNGYARLSEIADAVKNGTVLPKGHGRLIDVKEANALIAEGKNDKAYFGTVNKDWEVIDFLKTVSTIIEADKET